MNSQEQAQGSMVGPGFNVVGPVSENLGVAVTARAVVRLLLERNLPVAVYDLDWQLGRSKFDRSFDHLTVPALTELPHEINLFVLPPMALVRLFMEHPSLVFGCERLNVGFCPWELAVLAEPWVEWLEVLDAVVAESDFIRSTFQSNVFGVSTIAALHPLYIPEPITPRKSAFGLPEDAVVFISSFDPYSDPQRKNPFAVLQAFKQAFGHGGSAQLVLKLNNSPAATSTHPVLESLRALTRDNPNITVIEDTFSYTDILCLYASCDVFVSLHRSEGLGLGLMEAMFLGKPVIATAWSGNMSYMNEKNSCLVSYRLVPTDGVYSAYKNDLFDGKALWAEPSVDDAAAWMRRLVDDRSLRISIGRQAAEDMRLYESKAKQGLFIDDLLEIWRQGGGLHPERKANRQRKIKMALEHLEAERDSLSDRVGALDRERNDLLCQRGALLSERSRYEERVANLEQQISDMKNSRSWRWTAPLRGAFDLLSPTAGGSTGGNRASYSEREVS